MKIVPRLLLVLSTASFVGAQSPAVPPDGRASDASVQYIRYLEAPEVEAPTVEAPAAEDVGGVDRLQTAVVRFEKDGTVVDLVGVVHLGDAAYYDKLSERLATYNTVLYEMVGGPHRREDSPADGSDLESLRQLQQLAKSLLGLEFQLDAIDYGSPNFVHADLAWEEFEALMKARNETLLTLFQRASGLAEKGALPGLPDGEAGAEAMVGRLLGAVLAGNSAELKRTIAPFLSEAESLISRLEGEDGTVLVGERNRVVMEKLAAVREDNGRGPFAIFYGAGHMPDLEERLLREGFTKAETVWFDAWSIPRGQVASGTGESPLPAILRLLSENPEIQSGLRSLGTSLEDIGGLLKSLPEPPPAARP